MKKNIGHTIKKVIAWILIILGGFLCLDGVMCMAVPFMTSGLRLMDRIFLAICFVVMIVGGFRMCRKGFKMKAGSAAKTGKQAKKAETVKEDKSVKVSKAAEKAEAAKVNKAAEKPEVAKVSKAAEKPAAIKKEKDQYVPWPKNGAAASIKTKKAVLPSYPNLAKAVESGNVGLGERHVSSEGFLRCEFTDATDKVKYYYFNDGTLVFVGTGAVKSVDSGGYDGRNEYKPEEAPWSDKVALNATRAIFTEGITTIGHGLLHRLKKLEELYLADSVVAVFGNTMTSLRVLHAGANFRLFDGNFANLTDLRVRDGVVHFRDGAVTLITRNPEVNKIVQAKIVQEFTDVVTTAFQNYPGLAEKLVSIYSYAPEFAGAMIPRYINRNEMMIKVVTENVLWEMHKLPKKSHEKYDSKTHLEIQMKNELLRNTYHYEMIAALAHAALLTNAEEISCVCDHVFDERLLRWWRNEFPKTALKVQDGNKMVYSTDDLESEEMLKDYVEYELTTREKQNKYTLDMWARDKQWQILLAEYDIPKKAGREVYYAADTRGMVPHCYIVQQEVIDSKETYFVKKRLVKVEEVAAYAKKKQIPLVNIEHNAGVVLTDTNDSRVIRWRESSDTLAEVRIVAESRGYQLTRYRQKDGEKTFVKCNSVHIDFKQCKGASEFYKAMEGIVDKAYVQQMLWFFVMDKRDKAKAAEAEAARNVPAVSKAQEVMPEAEMEIDGATLVLHQKKAVSAKQYGPVERDLLHQFYAGSHIQHDVTLRGHAGKWYLVSENCWRSEHDPAHDVYGAAVIRMPQTADQWKEGKLVHYAIKAPNIRVCQTASEVRLYHGNVDCSSYGPKISYIYNWTSKTGHDSMSWEMKKRETWLHEKEGKWYVIDRTYWIDGMTQKTFETTMIMTLLPGMEDKPVEELMKIVELIPCVDPDFCMAISNAKEEKVSVDAVDLVKNVVHLFRLSDSSKDSEWIGMDKRNGDLYKCIIKKSPYYDTRDFNMPKFEPVSYEEFPKLVDQAPDEKVVVGNYIRSPKPYRNMTRDTWKRGYKIAIRSLVPGRPKGQIEVVQVVSSEEKTHSGNAFEFEKTLERMELVKVENTKFVRQIKYNCVAGANTRPEYSLSEEYYRVVPGGKDGQKEYVEEEPAFIYSENGVGVLY